MTQVQTKPVYHVEYVPAEDNAAESDAYRLKIESIFSPADGDWGQPGKAFLADVLPHVRKEEKELAIADFVNWCLIHFSYSARVRFSFRRAAIALSNAKCDAMFNRMDRVFKEEFREDLYSFRSAVEKSIFGVLLRVKKDSEIDLPKVYQSLAEIVAMDFDLEALRVPDADALHVLSSALDMCTLGLMEDYNDLLDGALSLTLA